MTRPRTAPIRMTRMRMNRMRTTRMRTTRMRTAPTRTAPTRTAPMRTSRTRTLRTRTAPGEATGGSTAPRMPRKRWRMPAARWWSKHDASANQCDGSSRQARAAVTAVGAGAATTVSAVAAPALIWGRGWSAVEPGDAATSRSSVPFQWELTRAGSDRLASDQTSPPTKQPDYGYLGELPSQSTQSNSGGRVGSARWRATSASCCTVTRPNESGGGVSGSNQSTASISWSCSPAVSALSRSHRKKSL